MKNINENWNQDESGQWWFTFGSRRTRTRGMVRKCLHCGEEYLTLPQRLKRGGGKGKFCSTACGSKALGGHRNKTGSDSHCWRGGRNIVRGGYVEIFKPDHPYARGGKYVREHRLVMEEHLGRLLKPWEQVHHKNAIKDDNRLENLELISGKVHLGEVECPHCQKTFSIK